MSSVVAFLGTVATMAAVGALAASRSRLVTDGVGAPAGELAPDGMRRTSAGVRLRVSLVDGVRARRRRQALDAEVPLLLDVLAAGSAAGLAAPLAMERSVPVLRGPLGDELAHVMDRVSLGARWRDELASLASRSGSHDLQRVVATLARTESLGSSLSTAMVELADDVRDARAARLAERARKAPVKMLFPLVFLVLPAFLLLTVVPVLLSTVRSIG